MKTDKRESKNNRASRVCGTTSSALICVFVVPIGDKIGRAQGQKKKKKKFEQIMAVTFLNLMKIINLHIQEIQQTLNRETRRKPH